MYVVIVFILLGLILEISEVVKPGRYSGNRSEDGYKGMAGELGVREGRRQAARRVAVE